MIAARIVLNFIIENVIILTKFAILFKFWYESCNSKGIKGFC
jgi:hypothetical protein